MLDSAIMENKVAEFGIDPPVKFIYLEYGELGIAAPRNIDSLSMKNSVSSHRYRIDKLDYGEYELEELY